MERAGILFALVSFVAVHSHAQWIASGYLGEAHTLNSALDVRQPALGTDIHFSAISYHGESFQSPLYYGVRAGRLFHRRLGAEVEFTHLKIFANVDRPSAITGTLNGAPIDTRTTVNTIVQRFSISHGVNLLLANAVFRRQLGRTNNRNLARAYLNLRLGGGATIPHAESTIQGLTDEHYQAGSPVIQVAGEVELRICRRLYWMGEYKFTRTHQEVDVSSGSADALFESNHVVTGPAVHF